MIEQLPTDQVLSWNLKWNNPEEAGEVLERFCLLLNIQFQGDPAQVEMPDKW